MYAPILYKIALLKPGSDFKCTGLRSDGTFKATSENLRSNFFEDLEVLVEEEPEIESVRRLSLL